MITALVIIISSIVVLYVIHVYNKLISLRNLNKEGWSGIDVQLKQRANLIPNLVESVKGYMGHESSVLQKVTELRSQSLASQNMEDRAAKENMLTSALRQLFALSENYPDLKASQNFIELQKTLESLENQIQLARRYYNGTVRDYNTALQTFPSNIVANSFHFQLAEFFGITDDKERKTPSVKFS